MDTRSDVLRHPNRVLEFLHSKQEVLTFSCQEFANVACLSTSDLGVIVSAKALDADKTASRNTACHVWE